MLLLYPNSHFVPTNIRSFEKKMSYNKEFRLALSQIQKCPFYWGKIDRKQAEAILKDEPNGSYLLKDPEEKEGDKEKWLLELVWIIDSKNYYCKSKYLVHYHHGHPILRKKPFSLLELAKNEIRNTGINVGNSKSNTNFFEGKLKQISI